MSIQQPMTDDQGRKDSGQFDKKYPDEWFINALRHLGGSGGTSKIHEKLQELYGDVAPPRRTVNNRLEELDGNGIIDCEKVGSGKTSAYNCRLIIDNHERVHNIVQEIGAAASSVYAQNLQGLTHEEVEDILKDLENEGKLKSEKFNDSVVWIPVD